MAPHIPGNLEVGTAHIAKYEKYELARIRASENRTSRGWGTLVAHADGEGNQDIITIVYTMCSKDCRGGHLRLATSDSGNEDKLRRNCVDFAAPDNSLYFFCGSYVKHGVGLVTSGCKVVVVLFAYWSHITPVDVVQFWTTKSFFCPLCLHAFASKKTLYKHISCNQSGASDCQRNSYITRK